MIKSLSEAVSRITPAGRLVQIRAIGLGHFCHKGNSSSGALQLALLLVLKEHFKCDVTFQEPIATDSEKVVAL